MTTYPIGSNSAASSDKYTALRLKQRNDGLGGHKNAKIVVSGSNKATSKQASRAGRLSRQTYL